MRDTRYERDPKRHKRRLGTQIRDTKIRAVLFDLGETLLNFGKVDTAALFREGARLSYDYLKGQRQAIGSFGYYRLRSLVSLRVRRWISNVRGKDFDALTVLKKAGIKKGVELSEQQWRHYAWLWYEPLSRVSRLEPRTVETLTCLRDRGLKLGIVSNTFINASSLEKQLEQLGVLDFFEVRLYSYEFDFRKPDTRIFRAAAERIGERPENILFVGDRIDKDIKPALKAGMKAVLKTAYTNAGGKIPEGVRKISRLCELPDLIEKINTGTAAS